jgi:predicted DNA binding CopG/RHH family protein
MSGVVFRSNGMPNTRAEPVTGAKEKQFMNAKINYTNEPIEAKVVRDFLPPPEQLAFREEGVKVTLALSKKSVDFFKAEAAKHHTQYQRMLRRLIDAYVETYAQAPTASVPKPARRKASSS